MNNQVMSVFMGINFKCTQVTILEQNSGLAYKFLGATLKRIKRRFVCQPLNHILLCILMDIDKSLCFGYDILYLIQT